MKNEFLATDKSKRLLYKGIQRNILVTRKIKKIARGLYRIFPFLTILDFKVTMDKQPKKKVKTSPVNIAKESAKKLKKVTLYFYRPLVDQIPLWLTPLVNQPFGQPSTRNWLTKRYVSLDIDASLNTLITNSKFLKDLKV